MKRLFIALIPFLLLSCKKSPQSLFIYSIEHEEETKAICDLFTKKTGIDVKYLRASTGELINRILNEKNSPQADLLLGGATSYHKILDEAGCLEPTPVLDFESGQSESGFLPYHKFCLLTLSIAVNRERFLELYKAKSPPRTWDDLLDPAFKGEVVIPDPRTSSTAYLFLQNQLQRLGEEKGWEYLKLFEPQVAQFPATGDAPSKLVGTGEYAIAVGFSNAFIKWAMEGFDLVTITPVKAAADYDCVSITKGARHSDLAKSFLSFSLGEEAQSLFSSISKTVPVNPNANTGDLPNIETLDLLELDSTLAAQTKDATLSKWSELTAD